MPLKILVILFFLSIITSLPALSQTANIDSVHTNATPPATTSLNQNNSDDEFNLFLFLFATSMLSFIAGFCMLGIAVFLLLLLLVVLLVTTGVISTSVFIGWMNHSYKSGVKAFLLITGSICGVIAGTLTFGIICLLFKISLTKSTILISGAGTGLIGGLFCGYIIFKVTRYLGKIFKRKWKVITT